MSIVNVNVDIDKQVDAVLMRCSTNDKGEIIDEPSAYNPTKEENDVTAMVLKHFVLSTNNMYTPRVEFNDLSLITRDQYDAMTFNTYQPNNGEAWEGSPQSAWRSRAMRPVVRNKCMSIAAHATARLIFPKVFAFNDQSEEQKEAAIILEDLMEWSGDISNYPNVALQRVITAMYSPASIGYTEYGEVTRLVKREKNKDGTWRMERVPDEAYPCFMDEVVPVSQFYIENFYEPDVQKQGWLIWRKVYSYTVAQSKYQNVENFKYVRPGVQTIYDDANKQFYYVYDQNMRQEDVEEVNYWNKNLDLKITLVNGVLMTPHDNPNPRNDKLYPFDKFGYEMINSRFFYYKSLAFKLQHDAEIVNTLYQMVIDGTYLSIFKPMVNVGGEIIASDVIIPGAVTTLSDPNADLRAINVGSDLKAGLETLSVVEKSINESSQEPLQSGVADSGSQTAYEISKLEQNANTILGLFLQMIAKHVKDYGKLRLGDVLQYLTLPDVAEIEGDPKVLYKSFFVKGSSPTGEKNKRIEFTTEYGDKEMEDEDYLEKSFSILKEEKDKDMEIAKVNPILLRKIKYMVTLSPDILNPRSEDLERAYALEDFDRMIAQPMVFDPEETGKLLLSHNPLTKKDPEKYLVKQAQVPGAGPLVPNEMLTNPNAMPDAGNSPLAALGGAAKNNAPKTPVAGMAEK